VLLQARDLCGWEARCEALSEHGAGSGEHEDRMIRRRRAPILGVTVMSFVGLLGIWRRRRGTPPPTARWGLRADTVDGVLEKRMEFASAWGVVIVNPHMQRQSCTPMPLKKHTCTPHKITCLQACVPKKPARQFPICLHCLQPQHTRLYKQTGANLIVQTCRLNKEGTRRRIGDKSLCIRQRNLMAFWHTV